MKKTFIIANWKSKKTEIEAKLWLQEFSNLKSQNSNLDTKEVIVCPSFTLLSIFKSSIINLKLPIKLGAQDISPFDEGAYTGEVNGKQIKELAEFVIIGHSERRKYFKEDSEKINKKIQLAFSYGLTPILCISEIKQIQNVKIKMQNYNIKCKILVAYEPLFAIGSKQPDTPEDADSIAEEIKKLLEDVYVIYGGSVNADNVNGFVDQKNIDGVLVGGASLDANEFSKIIANV